MNTPKTGFTCGAMDLLHAGHILMLQDCKSQCEHLIVGIHTNPQLDRIPYETEADLIELLKAVPIDIRFVGSDWKDKPFTGYDLPGMLEKTFYNDRAHDYSSSGLRKRIYQSSTSNQ